MFGRWVVAPYNIIRVSYRFQRACADYFATRGQMFGFPGFHLVKAFELAIMGWHYRQVVDNILKSDREVFSAA